MTAHALPEAVDFPGEFPHTIEEKMINFLQAVLHSMQVCCPDHYLEVFGNRGLREVRAAMLGQIAIVSETLAINSKNLQLVTQLLRANIHIADYRGRVVLQHSAGDFTNVVYAVCVGGRYFAARS